MLTPTQFAAQCRGRQCAPFSERKKVTDYSLKWYEVVSKCALLLISRFHHRNLLLFSRSPNQQLIKSKLSVFHKRVFKMTACFMNCLLLAIFGFIISRLNARSTGDYCMFDELLKHKLRNINCILTDMQQCATKARQIAQENLSGESRLC